MERAKGIEPNSGAAERRRDSAALARKQGLKLEILDLDEVSLFRTDPKKSCSESSENVPARKRPDGGVTLGRGLLDVTVLQGADRLDYLEARRLLPAGRTLAEAVKALIARPEIKPIRLGKLVEAFVASKESATRHGSPASDRYLKDIRSRLDRFSEAMQMDAHTIIGSEIEEWASQLSGRNRFNSLRLIRTLLKWGQKRGHLPPGPLPTDQIEIAFRDIETPEIFRPSELRKLLEVARPEMVPYLALGAFAGLRTAEIERLDWTDVKFDRGHVEITAGKAKTASRRLVPILPALRAWLENAPEGRWACGSFRQYGQASGGPIDCGGCALETQRPPPQFRFLPASRPAGHRSGGP